MIYPSSIITLYYVDGIYKGGDGGAYIRGYYVGDLSQTTRACIVSLKSCPYNDDGEKTTFAKFTFTGTVPEWLVGSGSFYRSKAWGKDTTKDQLGSRLTAIAWFETSTAPAEYLIALSSFPKNVATLFGGGVYPEGNICLISEMASSKNYKFLGWYEDDALVYPLSTNSFSVTKNRSLVAKYAYYSGLILRDSSSGIILKSNSSGEVLRDAIV